MRSNPLKNEKGMALILVIWVLVLLIALGTEFAYSMRTEVNTTRNYKEDTEAYYLAKAGINLAMAEIMKKARYHSWTEEKGLIVGEPLPPVDGTPQEELPEPEIEEVIREDIPLGNGTITYSITDENGKIYLNAANRSTLIKVLEGNGMESGSERDIIADSILDWIDQDNNHRLNGAESDYYRAQFPSYQAKNAPFDSLEELLKVRGVTPELFYGDEDFDELPLEDREGKIPGLIRMFTVQKIPYFNPNTATPEVLGIVYPDTQVQEILDSKAGKGYHSLSLSSHFRIKATGFIEGSETRHTIIAIIEKAGTDDKAKLLIRYWKDNSFNS